MGVLKDFFLLYKDGFMHLKVGKKLWLIVIIKLFIFFVVIKVFFFPNILDIQFKTDRERATYILDHLVNPK